MLELLTEVLPMLIPIIALMIGFVIVGSIFIVHPLVSAITRLTQAQNGGSGGLPASEVRQLEERLSWLETNLQRIIEERNFELSLQESGSSATTYLEAAETDKTRDR